MSARNREGERRGGERRGKIKNGETREIMKMQIYMRNPLVLGLAAK